MQNRARIASKMESRFLLHKFTAEILNTLGYNFAKPSKQMHVVSEAALHQRKSGFVFLGITGEK